MSINLSRNYYRKQRKEDPRYKNMSYKAWKRERVELGKQREAAKDQARLNQAEQQAVNEGTVYVYANDGGGTRNSANFRRLSIDQVRNDPRPGRYRILSEQQYMDYKLRADIYQDKRQQRDIAERRTQEGQPAPEYAVKVVNYSQLSSIARQNVDEKLRPRPAYASRIVNYDKLSSIAKSRVDQALRPKANRIQEQREYEASISKAEELAREGYSITVPDDPVVRARIMRAAEQGTRERIIQKRYSTPQNTPPTAPAALPASFFVGMVTRDPVTGAAPTNKTAFPFIEPYAGPAEVSYREIPAKPAQEPKSLYGKASDFLTRVNEKVSKVTKPVFNTLFDTDYQGYTPAARKNPIYMYLQGAEKQFIEDVRDKPVTNAGLFAAGYATSGLFSSVGSSKLLPPALKLAGGAATGWYAGTKIAQTVEAPDAEAKGRVAGSAAVELTFLGLGAKTYKAVNYPDTTETVKLAKTTRTVSGGSTKDITQYKGVIKQGRYTYYVKGANVERYFQDPNTGQYLSKSAASYKISTYKYSHLSMIKRSLGGTGKLKYVQSSTLKARGLGTIAPEEETTIKLLDTEAMYRGKILRTTDYTKVYSERDFMRGVEASFSNKKLSGYGGFTSHKLFEASTPTQGSVEVWKTKSYSAQLLNGLDLQPAYNLNPQTSSAIPKSGVQSVSGSSILQSLYGNQVLPTTSMAGRETLLKQAIAPVTDFVPLAAPKATGLQKATTEEQQKTVGIVSIVPQPAKPVGMIKIENAAQKSYDILAPSRPVSVLSSQKPATKVQPDYKLSIGAMPALKADTKPTTETITRPTSETITRPVFKSILRPMLKPILKTMTRPVTKTVTRPVGKTITVPAVSVVPTVPPPPVPTLQIGTGSKSTGGFIVEILRKKRWQKLQLKGAFNYMTALSKGARAVDTGAAASFRLKKSALPVSRQIDTFFSRNQSKYRSSKKLKDVYVERSRYRIDSPGELRQITMKGIMAQRKAAAQMFKKMLGGRF